jgi:hypothetical protein
VYRLTTGSWAKDHEHQLCLPTLFLDNQEQTHQKNMQKMQREMPKVKDQIPCKDPQPLYRVIKKY